MRYLLIGLIMLVSAIVSASEFSSHDHFVCSVERTLSNGTRETIKTLYTESRDTTGYMHNHKGLKEYVIQVWRSVGEDYENVNDPILEIDFFKDPDFNSSNRIKIKNWEKVKFKPYSSRTVVSLNNENGDKILELVCFKVARQHY